MPLKILKKSLQKQENPLEDLQVEQKQLNELHDHLYEQRHDLRRECSQAHHDYENLEASKHDLWIECDNDKKIVKFLNDKLEQNKALKGKPQDVVKLHQEIISLRENLPKFVGGIEKLDKLLGFNRCPSDRFGHGCEGEIYDHDDKTIAFHFYGKIEHDIQL